MEVTGSIPGLPQAGILANNRLVQHLADNQYIECPNTPCLFRHTSRETTFTLVVDDFGVSYKNEEDAKDFLTVLQKQYAITINRTGTSYLGLTILWDRMNRTVTISLPGHVAGALTKLHFSSPAKRVNSPTPFIAPKYGTESQLLDKEEMDNSPTLSAEWTTWVQSAIGSFLYYARAVDPLMECAVSKLGSRQASPTEKVKADVMHFLAYAHTWPNASITYHASDMKLYIYTDASYLSETKSRSRAGAIYYLGNNKHDPTQVINGSFDVLSTIISTVVSAASEAEYAAQFEGGARGEQHRSALADLGYPQNATPIISDNSVAVGIAMDTVKQRRSRSIFMRYHWIRDRVRLGHYTVIYEKGENNKADFLTKTLSPSIFHSRRHWYDSSCKIPENLESTPTKTVRTTRLLPKPFKLTSPARLLIT